MFGFTVEESNLLSIYAGKTRLQTISELGEALMYQQDAAMSELIRKVMAVLDNMSDEQFAGYEFVAAESEE